MAAGNNVKNTLKRCPNCGEDYSTTYKKCPFCDGRPIADNYDDYDGYDDYDDYDDYDGDASAATPSARPRARGGRRGGRRLAGNNKGGGGYGGKRSPTELILLVLSLVTIAVALWIIFSIILPKPEQEPDPINSPGVTSNIDPDPTQTGTTTPETTTPEIDDPMPGGAVTTPEPTPTETTPPSEPSGKLTLSRQDFTLNNANPNYRITTTGASGTVTWSTSNSAVATVSANGTVTAQSTGNATITAVDEAGKTGTCIVRVASGFSSSSPSTTADPPPTTTSSSSARLSSSDFTLSEQYGLTYKLTVRGADAEVTSWTSSNTSVATVADDGTVRGVGSGTATITATLEDGTTLKATVRVSM